MVGNDHYDIAIGTSGSHTVAACHRAPDKNGDPNGHRKSGRRLTWTMDSSARYSGVDHNFFSGHRFSHK
ncbi:hypothetical protein IEQ34_003067 [Dendrobium chrysotoxum]|uniref:Uncharacterized protein n=1 Tax=Dendrobium chrysotoxum TaxID=161865 RepID=A0AAV7HJH9_DENCH|nr:hypothetical protein IEQ34_003067 [Dendrobium chrysotoxum]